MKGEADAFPESLEAQFRAARMQVQAGINVTTFWVVALLVMLFSWWDWFVDPLSWSRAFAIRCAGSVVIVACGLTQRISGRVDWAPAIAKVRYAAGVLAVAAALAVLDRGYLVGIAGLIAVVLAGPYLALDRRDLILMNVVPITATVVIMYAAGLDRFEFTNSAIFLALALAVSLLLARVFEASNRRAFALEHELAREARTDAMTGLRNRRAVEEAGNAEVKRSARTGAPLALILGDIDHFKLVNDRHGHDVGDRVIRAVAGELRTVVRDTDTLGRWGGEEFLAILPDTDEREAAILAERMRATVEGAVIEGNVRVTISLGVAGAVASAGAEASQWDQLVRMADRAMYSAKEAGRNRVAQATVKPVAAAAV